MEESGHCLGLHLEDSRCYESFVAERQYLEEKLGRRVYAFFKHGSGIHRYGRFHYAPYEPAKYVLWAQQAGMKTLLGNLEDPRLLPQVENGLTVFPAVFWLEPHWRDTQQFPWPGSSPKPGSSISSFCYTRITYCPHR